MEDQQNSIELQLGLHQNLTSGPTRDHLQVPGQINALTWEKKMICLKYLMVIWQEDSNVYLRLVFKVKLKTIVMETQASQINTQLCQILEIVLVKRQYLKFIADVKSLLTPNLILLKLRTTTPRNRLHQKTTVPLRTLSAIPCLVFNKRCLQTVPLRCPKLHTDFLNKQKTIVKPSDRLASKVTS